MTKEKNKISGLIITRNEEKHIDEVLDNVSFVDEIIVIDSYSTDQTIPKLQKHKHVKIIQREFKDFADQRNFAIDQASHPWILFIDADERIPIKLKEELITNINSESNIVAYKFPRDFIFQNKVMRYSGLQTDFIYRLFKKGHAKYRKDKPVHEILEVNGQSKTLVNAMLHYSFSDYTSYKNKIEQYAKLNAQELFLKGKKSTFFGFYIKPAYKFLYNYIIRFGFLDGKAGYTICTLNAYGVKYRFNELKRLITISSKP